MSLNQKRNRKIKLLKEQDGKCVYCGEPLLLVDTTIDHVIPKSQNGSTNSISNLVASCQCCNQAFGNQSPKAKILELYQLAFA